MKKQAQESNIGHRQRIREKFLNAGLDGFLDYEIIELLLTLGTPRKDCKQQAKEAINKFKNLNGVLDASLQELQEVKGIGPSNAFGIKLVQSVNERYLKNKIDPQTLLNDPKQVFEYLREKIGKKKKEHFTILCFDTKNKLISCDVSVGTLNASLVHPREVFNEAIINHASYIIVAHNHPSGDPTPSRDDIATTSRLINAGKILGISVEDHVIVTSAGYRSLREMKIVK